MSLVLTRTIADLEKDGCIVAIQDGNHGEKHPKSTDYVDIGIPFVMGNNLGGGFIDLEGCYKISRDQADKLRIGFSKSGDVLLTHKGTIGNVAILPDVEPYVMLTPQVTYYRVNDEMLSRDYLAYAFRDPVFQANMKSQAQQSTRPYIGITAQRRLKLKWHERSVQDHIVGVIKNYDDLIENNRRRITLLEEAARLLYREWFVHFRFPGHEHVKVIDGVPEGWLSTPMVELVEMVMGQSPKSEFYNTTGDGLPFHQGVTNYGFRFVSDVTYSTKVTKLADAGDILFSVRAPVGRINITLNKMVVGRGLAAFRSKKSAQSFLLYQLKNHFFKEDLIGGGAIYAATNKKELEKLELLQPTDEIVETFEQFAAPIDDQIRTLTLKADQLEKARDLLLPRLMDGRLEI